jgi:hypothetical protein
MAGAGYYAPKFASLILKRIEIPFSRAIYLGRMSHEILRVI